MCVLVCAPEARPWARRIVGVCSGVCMHVRTHMHTYGAPEARTWAHVSRRIVPAAPRRFCRKIPEWALLILSCARACESVCARKVCVCLKKELQEAFLGGDC